MFKLIVSMFNIYSYFSISVFLIILVLTFSYNHAPAHAISNTADLKNIGIDEKLGDKIAIDSEFINQDGEIVTIGQFFNEKPVVINMLYLSCPRVCTFALDGSLEVINETTDLELGSDYEFLSVSFNPEETHTLSSEKSEKYFEGLKNKKYEDEVTGWNFLTSDHNNIDKLTRSI